MLEKIQYYYFSKDESADIRPGLISGSIFNGIQGHRLRIDAPPGTQFIINYETGITQVGSSGFYELDLGEGNEYIRYLRFKEESLDIIDNSETMWLLVEIEGVKTKEENKGGET